jgi:uncharacterized protein (TIGR02453 family)
LNRIIYHFLLPLFIENSFKMLHKNTLQFLAELNENNNKVWFDENRPKYEAAKKDFETFVTEVLQANVPLIPELEGRKAKDCIFRIFKDVRFSKDKIPYKNNFGAGFGKGDKKVHAAGFYLHVQPGGHSFMGGGIWMPESNDLKAIRQEIDYNFPEFSGIVNHKPFKKMFGDINSEDKLKKKPQGYEENNPAIEYLKLKSFTVGTNISDKDILGKTIVSQLHNIVKEMKPFVDFLNRAVV